MYGSAPPTKAAPAKPGSKAPPAAKPKAAAPDGAGSIDWALASTFDRIEAKYRDDPEKLAQAREQRSQLGAFLRERKVDPQDAHAMLTSYREHQGLPRSAEALQSRWAGPAGFEALRLEVGDTEGAKRTLERANNFFTAVAQAAPGFAQEAKLNGAVEIPEVIRIAAKYGEAPSAAAGTTTPKET